MHINSRLFLLEEQRRCWILSKQLTWQQFPDENIPQIIPPSSIAASLEIKNLLKKEEANLSSVQQLNVRCMSLERLGDICVNCRASPAADDFLISLLAFPNQWCLCFPGSLSYSQAAAECLKPWLWPPFGLEQTWNWNPVLTEHRRTSWPATQ